MKELRSQETFVSVSYGMTEVEYITQAALLLIKGYNLSLDLCRAHHDPLQSILHPVESVLGRWSADCSHELIRAPFKSLEALLMSDGSCLDDLRHSIDQLTRRQGLQEVEIHVDSLRLLESPN